VAIEIPEGVTDIEARAVPVTLTDAVALTEPEAAVIVACPVDAAVTNPEAFTAATDWLLEDHVTRLVTSCAVPSL
jgi:hypothetical protein